MPDALRELLSPRGAGSMIIGNSRVPYQLFAKLFVRWSPRERLLRLGRIVWAKGKPGRGGYSAKCTLALTPRAFTFCRGHGEWQVTLLGIRVHYQKAYGGWIA